MPPLPNPDPGATSSDEALLAALNEELLRLNRQRRVAPPESVLEASSLRILWALHRSGPRTLRELAGDLQLEQSTVNRQVNRAIERGLVERYAVAGSASRYLRPTEAGRRDFEHDVRLHTAVQHRALATLGRDRLARMVADLGLFNDAFERAAEE